MYKIISITKKYFLENPSLKKDNLKNQAFQRYNIGQAIIWQKKSKTQTSSKQLTKNIKHKCTQKLGTKIP